MKKIGFVLASFALFYYTGCGGGAASSGGSSTGGTATAGSLSSVPSSDLSTVDTTTGVSSSLSSVPKSLSISKDLGSGNVSKGLGENFDAVGATSRAFCEANMQKREIFREGQMTQLSRCYPEAMERAGFITIPNGSKALYKISPPEIDDKTKFCDEIPAFETERKAACLSGDGGGPGGGNILLRIGIIDGELQIDECEGNTGAEKLVHEASYGVTGSVYTANVSQQDTWQGNTTEKMEFSMSVDLGASGKVSNGTVSLGSSGTATATAEHNGSFGKGTMTFAANAADKSTTIKGVFVGEFKDPLSGGSNSFTGKVFSKMGGTDNTGCSKFSFTGTMPPMRVSDMVPFNITGANLTNFLASFSAELGVTLNAANYQLTYLCPNPNFNSDSTSSTVKPMVLATQTGSIWNCPSVTHSDTECFAITNATEKKDRGTTVTQTGTIIANTSSEFFANVNAFDLSTLSNAAKTLLFSRNWNCGGNFTTLDFASFTPAQLQAAEAELSTCFALEEKLNSNRGMGEYDCGKEEQQHGVNDFAENGGGSSGKFGGNYAKRGSSTACATAGLSVPEGVFIDSINLDTNQYCIPLGGSDFKSEAAVFGSCASFTVVGGGLSETKIEMGGLDITELAYTQVGNDPATAVVITWNNGVLACNDTYDVSQPSFGGVDSTACKVPTGCPFLTCDKCFDYCGDPSHTCTPL